MPGHLAGVDVDRHRRVRIEVVARAELRVVDRIRVAGADDVQLLYRVVRTGLPDAAAASLPGVVIVFPGLAARVDRFGHGIEPPQLVAGFHVERGDPPARARVAGAVLDDHFAVGDDRRGVEAFLTAE